MQKKLFPEVEKDTKTLEKQYVKESDELWSFIEELEQNIKPTVLKDVIAEFNIPIEKMELYDQLLHLGLT